MRKRNFNRILTFEKRKRNIKTSSYFREEKEKFEKYFPLSRGEREIIKDIFLF